MLVSGTPSYASSTARRDRASELRRRRRSTIEKQELETLLPKDANEAAGSSDALPLEYELREKKSYGSASSRDNDAWGRPSAYELQDSTFGLISGHAAVEDTVMDENAYRRSIGKVKRKLSDPEVPHPSLIQLDSPEQLPRRLLFEAPESSSMFSDPEIGLLGDRGSPRTLGNDSTYNIAPASPTLNGVSIAEATPCSLLSLSPISRSTQLPEAVVNSDFLMDDWDGLLSPGTRPQAEDDVLSLSGTTTSGYEDAEAYTPISGTRSPLRLSRNPSPRPASLLEGALDLSRLDNLARETGRRRGSMSVISVSDGESWAGDESDWVAESEDGS